MYIFVLSLNEAIWEAETKIKQLLIIYKKAPVTTYVNGNLLEMFSYK